MSNAFFDRPILNSPYDHPSRHWELEHGQPTQQIIEKRRLAEYITPLPKPKKRKGQAEQSSLFLDDDKGLSTQAQKYQKTAAIISTVRQEERNFVQNTLKNIKTAGVQQAHQEYKISFTSLKLWLGDLMCEEGQCQYEVGEKRAAIFIGFEFGTASLPDLVLAAREADDTNFDVLIACAFDYDAHSSKFDKQDRILVLKARMNADLNMPYDLKNTVKGNLFVIFGEPVIDILEAESGQIRVKVYGVDVFHPKTGAARSDGAESIACWFIDTDYNEESFFVSNT